MTTANTQRKNADGKERIRGSRLAVLVKRSEGVPFVEGLRMADEKGLVIASNKRLDSADIDYRVWEKIRKAFSCWSGTMTAYKKPYEELGKSVIYTDPKTKQRYVFPVPENYKEAHDAILVVEHPNYTLEKDGKDLVVVVQGLENINLVGSRFPSKRDPCDCRIDRVVPVSHIGKIGLVERFPPRVGYYNRDALHGIPSGRDLGYYRGARLLLRTDSKVGPIARGSYYYNEGHDLLLHVEPSESLGVVVEAPE